ILDYLRLWGCKYTTIQRKETMNTAFVVNEEDFENVEVERMDSDRYKTVLLPKIDYVVFVIKWYKQEGDNYIPYSIGELKWHGPICSIEISKLEEIKTWVSSLPAKDFENAQRWKIEV